MTATAQQLEYLKNSIQSIEDYPKPGILFRDVTSLLEDPKAYALSIELLTERYKDAGITKVVGTEARGFLFGAPVALALGVGFVPVRKPRKLPRETIAESYELEYGTDQLEIHVDAIKPGDKVLVVDDLLATGGTIDATVKLIRRLGGGSALMPLSLSTCSIWAANSAWRSWGSTATAWCRSRATKQIPPHSLADRAGL